MRSRPRRRSPRERRSSGCRSTAVCRTIFRTRPTTSGHRLHRLPASVFVSAVRAVRLELVRGGDRAGCGGMGAVLHAPGDGGGGGLKVSLRTARDRARTGDPVSRRDGGRGRDQSGSSSESRSRFTFLFEGGAAPRSSWRPGWPSTRAIASSTSRTAIRRIPTAATTPIRASSACPSSSTDGRLRRTPSPQCPGVRTR